METTTKARRTSSFHLCTIRLFLPDTLLFVCVLGREEDGNVKGVNHAIPFRSNPFPLLALTTTPFHPPRLPSLLSNPFLAGGLISNAIGFPVFRAITNSAPSFPPFRPPSPLSPTDSPRFFSHALLARTPIIHIKYSTQSLPSGRGCLFLLLSFPEDAWLWSEHWTHRLP